MLVAYPAAAQSLPETEATFLEMAADQSQPGPEPIATSVTDQAFLRQVNYNELTPGDVMADQARNAQPTPTPGYGFDGNSSYNLSTDPGSTTTGIRLDTAYGLARNVETAMYLSELQDTTLTGMTVLPYQSPCSVVGIRGMGGYADNMSVSSDTGVYSIDAFFGTRYKKLYHKIGAFIDGYDHWKKVGLAYSALTDLPILGVVTVDTAFGFSASSDSFNTNIRGYDFRSLRVEQTKTDYQIRVGKFWNEWVQTGFTGNYYPFDYVPDEWGAGGFMNLYLGRYQISGDVTGGKEGLRGYVKLAINWGYLPSQRPRDCNLVGVDPVAWVTRATDRDQSVRLRDSLTGPIPVAP